MKHSKTYEYYTCDRCGKKVEYKFSRLFTQLFHFDLKSIDVDFFQEDICKITERLKDIVENNAIKTDVSMLVNYKPCYKQFDLCRDCKKDLEKFLKMKL